MNTCSIVEEVNQPNTSSNSSLQRRQFLLNVYDRLYQLYGPQGWWPGDGPLEVVIGAILTQAAAWTNVERALSNLKNANCMSLQAIHECPQDELAAIVRPSGYFNAKARKLKAFAAHIIEHHGGSLDSFLARRQSELREELLGIHGIGPETADDVVLYAAHKPSFVIDSYTRRIIDRLGFFNVDLRSNYHEYQALFHNNLPTATTLFQEYHALLDRHAKETCAKTPRCSGCCLLALCNTGQANIADS